MTKLLDEAVDAVRSLPVDMQDEIARVMKNLAGESNLAPMTAEEEESFAKSRAQARQKDFASDERMDAIWSNV